MYVFTSTEYHRNSILCGPPGNLRLQSNPHCVPIIINQHKARALHATHSRSNRHTLQAVLYRSVSGACFVVLYLSVSRVCELDHTNHQFGKRILVIPRVISFGGCQHRVFLPSTADSLTNRCTDDASATQNTHKSHALQDTVT